MQRHVPIFYLLASALVVCMFLPFFPGEHDPFAIFLSGAAQVMGFAAVLLVPIGIVWLVFRKQKVLCVTASTAASIVVTLAFAFGAVAYNSLYLALGLLLLGAFLSYRFVRRTWQREPDANGFDPVPLYLIFIPLLVFGVRFAFIEKAVEFSRDRAIANSQTIIQDIEAFYARNGQYPESLLSLGEDYDPGLIGIPRYYYEPNGKAYNLYFEQFSDQIGVREIVMYNKLGEHLAFSHNQDRLLLSPADQIRQQGWLRVFDHPQKGWKYFWFD